ncbi:MAG: hypothetical protein ACFE0Q_18460 [Anaerolineae bacterium]
MDQIDVLWQPHQVRRLLVSLLITGILASAVMWWSAQYGPLLGYRYYQAPTLFTVSTPQQQGTLVTSTITNHELNAVTLMASVIIRDENGAERYRSEFALLPTLAPEQSHSFQHTLPSAYQTLADDWQVQVEVREFIAYVDGQADGREDFILRERQSEDLPAQIDTLTVTHSGGGDHQIELAITFYNPDEQTNDLRYTLTVNRANATRNRIILNDTIYESVFFPLTLEANAYEQTQHTLNITLEPGTYQVGLWVQRRIAEGQYVQYWQTNYPNPITYAEGN